MKYETTLKTARHKMHVHRDNWHVAVIVPTAEALDDVFLFTTVILEASSIAVEMVNQSTHTITTAHGATIRFFVVREPLDPYKLHGRYTHIIIMAEVPDIHHEYLHTHLGSSTVDSAELLFQTDTHY